MGIARCEHWQWRTLTSLDTCWRLRCCWKARFTWTWDLQVKTRVFHDSWLWYNFQLHVCRSFNSSLSPRSRCSTGSGTISHLEAVSAAAHCILGLSLFTLELKEIPCWERCDWEKNVFSLTFTIQRWLRNKRTWQFVGYLPYQLIQGFGLLIFVPVPHEKIDFSREAWLIRWSAKMDTPRKQSFVAFVCVGDVN